MISAASECLFLTNLLQRLSQEIDRGRELVSQIEAAVHQDWAGRSMDKSKCEVVINLKNFQAIDLLDQHLADLAALTLAVAQVEGENEVSILVPSHIFDSLKLEDLRNRMSGLVPIEEKSVSIEMF